MPRLLAIEWDQHEARFVTATTGRNRLTIDSAGSISLPQADDGERLPPAEVGQAVRAGLKQQGAGGGSCLLGISRSSIELCQITLPPIPDEDLPEAVRYQAARELSSFADSTLLDFVPLPAEEGEQRTVLAAAVSPEQAALLNETCQAAGLKPTRWLVRPHAAGSLFCKQLRPSERVSLLVTCLTDEADLEVVVDGRVLLCRTVRPPKPAEGESSTAPLLAEIKRTIFAVQNQPGGGPVSAVYLCGAPSEHRDLVEQIDSELSLPAEVFQPFSNLTLSRDLEERLPEHPGRYTALLGMVVDEASPSHAIDFLHPRKKPAPADRRRVAIMAASLVGLLLFAGLYNVWGRFADENHKIAKLKGDLKKLDQSAKKAAEKETIVAAIKEWQTTDVDWLDELRDLSLRFPKPRDAVLLRMTLAGKSSGGGSIELEGLVRDPSIVNQMESSLRDDFHEVRTKRVQESVQGANHTWKFDSSLLVGVRQPDKYLSHLSPEEIASRAQRATEVKTPPTSKASKRLSENRS